MPSVWGKIRIRSKAAFGRDKGKEDAEEKETEEEGEEEEEEKDDDADNEWRSAGVIGEKRRGSNRVEGRAEQLVVGESRSENTSMPS